MTEADLLSQLLRELRNRMPGAVVIKHCDRVTVGVPDVSVTFGSRTSWWEAKLADPDFKTQGIQELMLLRMAAAGYARYIVWEERKEIKRTMIVHPRYIGELQPESFCTGFNHAWLVDQIRKAHRL